MASYNVLFTLLPVIAMGVFNQDVSAHFCLKVPDAVPREPPEPAVPVAADHRVDGLRRCQCRGHLLPHHSIAAASRVPAGWAGGRPGDGEATKLCSAKLHVNQVCFWIIMHS